MLSAVSMKQSYIFDYLQTIPTIQPTTHFRTLFTLQPRSSSSSAAAGAAAGSVLVTLTAQTLEERYQNELQGTFDQIINSFVRE